MQHCFLQFLPVAYPGHYLHFSARFQSQVRPNPVQVLFIYKKGPAIQSGMGLSLSRVNDILINIRLYHKKWFGSTSHIQSFALTDGEIMCPRVVAYHYAIGRIQNRNRRIIGKFFLSAPEFQ